MSLDALEKRERRKEQAEVEEEEIRRERKRYIPKLLSQLSFE